MPKNNISILGGSSEPFRLAYTITEATKVTGFTRTRIYEEISKGRLTAVKAGRRTLIIAKSLERLIEALPLASIGLASNVKAQEVSNEK